MNQLVDDLGQPTWKNGPTDPFADLLINPDNLDEAQEYAREFYRTLRASHRKAMIGIGATITVASAPWFLTVGISNVGTRMVVTLGSALIALLLVNHIWQITVDNARSLRSAVGWHSWARSSFPLSEYLVTTSDPRRLWEAAGHQLMRSFVQRHIVHLNQYRVADLLNQYRADELSRYLERDDELRAKIVELCDPTPGERSW